MVPFWVRAVARLAMAGQARLWVPVKPTFSSVSMGGSVPMVAAVGQAIAASFLGRVDPSSTPVDPCRLDARNVPLLLLAIHMARAPIAALTIRISTTDAALTPEQSEAL